MRYAWLDKLIATLPIIKSADPDSDYFVYPGTEADWPWDDEEA